MTGINLEALPCIKALRDTDKDKDEDARGQRTLFSTRWVTTADSKAYLRTGDRRG
jgi:hypothetical protein